MLASGPGGFKGRGEAARRRPRDRARMRAVRGYVALGSNLGDREANLAAGLDGLERRGVAVESVSSVWETEPEGWPGAPWFLNLVARVRASGSPEDLLDAALDVEREVGRVRSARNAPRLLDIDLLTLDGIRRTDGRLVLPHPRMWSRRFVLAPLAELAPDLVDPRSRRSVADALAAARGGAIRRVGSLPRRDAPPYNAAARQSGGESSGA